MDIHHYIGIDISKATLDWAVFDGKALVWQTTTRNTVAGIKTALRQLKTLACWNPKQTVLCMEHMGIYNRTGGPGARAMQLMLDRSADAALPSMPMAPATRRFRDRMRLWEPPRPIIQPHGRPRTFFLKRCSSAAYSSNGVGVHLR